jgi:hypothetical protein
MNNRNNTRQSEGDEHHGSIGSKLRVPKLINPGDDATADAEDAYLK